jgi:malonyl-CoA/methylmalonyl-CoA synthetase
VPPADLLPTLREPGEAPAVRFPDGELSYAELRGAAGAVASQLEGSERVALWATPTIETVIGVVGALLAGVTVVPLNPKAGEAELGHLLADAEPGAVIAGPDEDLPPRLDPMRRIDADRAARSEAELPPPPDPEHTALIVYTSGTTGPPKGVMLPYRALASNLDALADAWEWTAADRVAQALPLFHVHGLIVGSVGPLRIGGSLEHVGRFSGAAIATALDRGATMVFGVPTMYTRLAADAEEHPEIAAALGRARLLVSGSAGLPSAVHRKIEALTGRRIAERYGMTETLMNTAVRAAEDIRPGSVGPPVAGVDLRLLDESGAPIAADDPEAIGEIAVRGPNLFSGYLNRPDATAEVMRDDWFLTGDMATRDAAGRIAIVGRRATDLIKSGGFKIGAGEVEAALLEHPDVAEVAVTGRPDDDLGEAVVAWVVPAPGADPTPEELTTHVCGLISSHKRPRTFHFVDSLPRNELGKVQKKRLTDPSRAA